MRTRVLQSFLVVSGLSAGLLAIGCGSKEDDKGGGGVGDGDDMPPDDISLSTGGGSGDGDLSGDGDSNPSGEFDGGSFVLTEDELADISDAACAGWQHEGEVLPSTIQLVIDVSSSMEDPAPGTNRSKWEVTRDLLLEGIVGVEGNGLPGSVAVGLLFYPNQDGVEGTPEPQDVSACVNVDALVSARPLGGAGDEHRGLVRDVIANAVTEQWTPTHDAFRYALDEGLLPSQIPGNKFMLLITDGAPTISLDCTQQEGQGGGVDPEPIVDEIARAAELGIRTFLIGSPGSEDNRGWMSRAAVIGGTAPVGCNVSGPVGEYCHMDMTTADDFTQALRDGLSRIAGVLTPCTYAYPEAPPGQSIDSNAINVIVKKADGTSTLIVRDDQGDCTEGWQFGDANEVVLCPETCSDVQLEPTTTVELAFGCGSVAVPVR
jgi:hypothetical protein